MASTEIYMGLKPQTSSGLTSVPVWAAPESASHSSKKGCVLTWASGYLDLDAVDGVADIVGISAEPGHNDSSAGTHDLMFHPALPGMKFEGTLEDETNNDHALVITNIGAKFALQLDTTNDNWYLDENDGSNVATLVIGAVDPLATVRARVTFIFLADTTIFGT